MKSGDLPKNFVDVALVNGSEALKAFMPLTYTGPSSAPEVTQDELPDIFHFQVTFTAFGEALAIESEFQRLPPEAQQLILGEKFPKVQEILESLIAHIQLSLPLVALGVMKATVWQSIHLQLLRIQASPGFDRLSPAGHIADAWTQAVWKNRENRLALSISADLLTNQNVISLIKHGLDPLHHAFLAPVLIQLLRLRIWNDRGAYFDAVSTLLLRALGRLQSEVSQVFLLNYIRQPIRHNDYTATLEALSNQQGADVCAFFLDYYRRKRTGSDLKPINLKYVLWGLHYYQDPVVHDIYCRHLFDCPPELHQMIFQKLTAEGFAEVDLVPRINFAFKDRTNPQAVSAAVHYFQLIQDDLLLPNIGELMDLLDWMLETEIDDRHFFQNFNALLQRKSNEINYQQVANWLEKEPLEKRETHWQQLAAKGKKNYLIGILALAGSPDVRVRQLILELAERQFEHADSFTAQSYLSRMAKEEVHPELQLKLQQLKLRTEKLFGRQ